VKASELHGYMVSVQYSNAYRCRGKFDSLHVASGAIVMGCIIFITSIILSSIIFDSYTMYSICLPHIDERLKSYLAAMREESSIEGILFQARYRYVMTISKLMSTVKNFNLILGLQ
jgi:hypothetical protein